MSSFRQSKRWRQCLKQTQKTFLSLSTWKRIYSKYKDKPFLLLLLFKVAPGEPNGEICLATIFCSVPGMLLFVVTREQWLCTTKRDLALHFNILAGIRHPDFTENKKCFWNLCLLYYDNSLPFCLQTSQFSMPIPPLKMESQNWLSKMPYQKMMAFIPVWLKTTQDRHLAVLRSQSKVNISACCNYCKYINYNLKKIISWLLNRGGYTWIPCFF